MPFEQVTDSKWKGLWNENVQFHHLVCHTYYCAFCRGQIPRILYNVFCDESESGQAWFWKWLSVFSWFDSPPTIDINIVFTALFTEHTISIWQMISAIFAIRSCFVVFFSCWLLPRPSPYVLWSFFDILHTLNKPPFRGNGEHILVRQHILMNALLIYGSCVSSMKGHPVQFHRKGISNDTLLRLLRFRSGFV